MSFINRLVEIGIGKEGTRGAGVAPTYWLPQVAFSFDNKANIALSGEAFGNISAETTGYVTEQWGEGSFEGEIRDKSFGLLLLALFGTSAPSAFGGVYKHALTLQNDNQHDSLCLAYKDPIGSLMFKLVMIERMSIELEAGQIARFTADFQSKASDDASAYTPAYVQENKFTSKHLALKVAADPGGLNAATALSIKSLTLNIEKNLVRDRVLGSLEPEDILNTAFRISGKLTFNYADRTYRTYVMDGRTRALRIDLVNSDRTIGTTNPAFRIDLPKVQFSEWERIGGLDDISEQTINFTAFYDPINNRIWSDCYIVNEVVSY